MLKDAIDFAKQVVGLTRKTQQHEEDIKTLRQDMKEMRQELRALADAMQQQRFEQQRDRENGALERENCCFDWNFCCAQNGNSRPLYYQAKIKKTPCESRLRRCKKKTKNYENNWNNIGKSSRQ